MKVEGIVAMLRRSVELTFAAISVIPCALAQTPLTLALNAPIEHSLESGGKEQFTLRAEAGQFVHIRLEKKGIDVVASVFDPNGDKLLSSSTPTDGVGIMDASFLAKKTGDYRLEVADKGALKLQGAFRVELFARRTPAAEDSLRLEAEDSFRAGLDQESGSADRKRNAIAAFSKSAELFSRLREPYAQSLALHRLALVHQGLGEYREAIDLNNQALAIRHTLGDRDGEARTLNNIGNCWADTGDLQKAIGFYNQSLPIARAIGDRVIEASLLNNLALRYSTVGDKQKTLDFYSQALLIRRALSDRSTEATLLNSIGEVYADLHDKQKALDFYNQALSVRGDTGDRSGEAQVLTNIALLYSGPDEKPKALDFFNRAQALYHAAGDRTGEAQVLTNIALLYSSPDEKPKALDFFNQALALYRAAGNRTGEAQLLNSMGLFYKDPDEKPKALDFFNQALTLYRAAGNHTGEAQILNNIGLLYKDPAEKSKSLDFFKQALALYRAAGDRRAEAGTLVNMARSAENEKAAIDVYSQARALFREQGDRPGEAFTLQMLGIASRADSKKSLEYYNLALPIYQALGNKLEEAGLLSNIGATYSDLPDHKKAIDFYMQALPTFVEAGDRSSEALTCRNLGLSYSELGDKAKSIDYYSRAIAISTSLNDRQGEDSVLHSLCPALEETGEKAKAAACYAQAAEVKKAIGDEDGEADALVSLAGLSDGASAAGRYEAALALYKKLNHRDSQVGTLRSLAKVYEGMGAYGKSYDSLRESLGTVHALLVQEADSQSISEVQSALEKLGADVHTVLPGSATAQNIASEISKIAEAARPDDAVLIFYSGPSAPTKSEYRLAAKQGEPSASAGISASLFRSWINRLPVSDVLICLAVPPEKGLDAFATRISGVGDPLSGLQDRNILVIGPSSNAIARPGSESSPPAALLARAFALSLTAGSDRNHDGFLSYQELEGAIYANMLSLQLDGPAAAGEIQRPQAYGSGGPDFAFATGIAPQTAVNRGVSPVRTAISDEVKKEFGGKYYALIIATDDYDHWNHLSNPLYDAKDVAKELHERYGFDTELVSNPTKEEFTNRLAAYKKKQFGPDDELLIFIAGHGTYDESEQTGYLIAKDSRLEDEAHNSQISQQQVFSIIKGLSARHVFLVVDACYGGAIAGLKRDDPKSDISYPAEAKLQALRRKRNDRTRIFLTSGGKEYVPDGQPGTHSPFAFQFLRALKSRNPGDTDSALTFIDFMSFADQVQNAPQPKYGWFPDADPASDFWLFADPRLRNPDRTETLPSVTQK